MAYLTISGLNSYYETYGEGETILLLHHGFGCTRMWKDIYPGLVKEGYSVVMYDRRGYGRSEEGPDFDQFYVSPSFRAEGIKELETVRKMLGFFSFGWTVRGRCGSCGLRNPIPETGSFYHDFQHAVL